MTRQVQYLRGTDRPYCPLEDHEPARIPPSWHGVKQAFLTRTIPWLRRPWEWRLRAGRYRSTPVVLMVTLLIVSALIVVEQLL